MTSDAKVISEVTTKFLTSYTADNKQLQSPGLSRQNGFRESSAQTATLELNRKLDKLGEEVKALVADGYNPEELDRHISLLHEYNDIKDVGQLLLGLYQEAHYSWFHLVCRTVSTVLVFL
ncbi:DNA repair protein SWI5 homolog isoform X2 [Protopterus annectens]|uniref:DNA repair protein SWI5 homolog isoform X2 n=1 Tax=Protopterus annectens TaxID=7888 RepID=UPI001CFB6A68|nr:DNA repair protein SWI5 homolog isoform X2 [Protopterus annectens]